ncbi:mercury methylation corrinoid protein HgcA [uncultured Desulfosarcina sp.]|uniref:mercury methylation corrinoid protein HgcA n=1 Tax=uncultured Desulfosarcina sp. TaxID=218289 RepID=UPI0029C8EF2A|nr:mercury methylation corrinoid protein HgcA [uncultured Desulfosarcina sp.]
MASCCPEAKDSRHSSPYSCQESSAAGLTPDFPVVSGNAASCCGIQPSEPHASVENPGFRRWGFVEDFMETPAGPVPRVRTRLIREDRLGTVSARLGIGRDRYSIAPGIYGVGSPDKESPVMVTANYKLSFDALRCSLAGISAWILVLDTRSINVWCAAGKGTFSTREVAERVKATGLDKIVTHRCLILPQLSATGVAARQVKTLCGFEVIWGPVHTRHINTFLENGMKATPAMRKVTFSFWERVELIPVELNHLGRPTLYLIPALFLLSGLGQGFFSVSAAFSRGLWATLAYLLAVAAGAVLAPVVLPWLPGRAFALKGAGLGASAGAMMSAAFARQLVWSEMLALTLFIMVVSSYLAMNFTGSTPFTSPTGVEKEMRRAIPAQAAGALAAVIFWVGAGFMGG